MQVETNILYLLDAPFFILRKKAHMTFVTSFTQLEMCHALSVSKRENLALPYIFLSQMSALRSELNVLVVTKCSIILIYTDKYL